VGPGGALGGGRIDGARDREVGRLDGAVGKSGGGHGPTEALEPVDRGGHVERPGDGADAPPADREQALGRRHAALEVVDVDVDVVVGDVGRAPAEDHGHLARGAMERVVSLVVRDDERAVDHTRSQVLQGLAGRVARRQQQGEQVLADVEAAGDPLHDRGEVRVAEEAGGVFGHDERDRARGAAGERTGRAVGHVVQLRDGLVDGAHHFGRDLRRAVDDAADGRP
jgi:hypothetical protein